ncbi:MAG: sugar phosphate isomerase/epimerase [Candidatus Poribacteria bacterium]|nr:sugar phosphate isomerase/epimerase [Candidatus Poribacteria bacterium]MDE0504341.1 sugar phosphate isomerase/epimerase [Candidatus Poribacteria bacterium]
MPKYGVNLLLWADKFDRESVDLIPKVAEMGFDGVEIPIFDHETVDIRHTKAALRDTNLHPIGCAIMTHDRNPIHEDAAIREIGKNYLKHSIDVLAELGGDTLVGPVYSAVGALVGRGRNQQEWDWCVDILGEVADFAGQRGVTVAMEPLNRFETYFLNIVADAIKLSSAVNSPFFKIHLDTFHMNIEEKNLAQAITNAGTLLHHLHACENDRGTPGTGLVDWEEVFNALARVNYDRWLVIESFTPAVKEIAAATAIWRDIAPSAEILATEGLAFLKRMSAKHLQ